MNARAEFDTYHPMVSQETLLEMAQEKVLEDEELFCDWLTAETMSPTEVRPCTYFGPASTKDLLIGILMKPRATEQQLAEAWREVRKRFVADHQEKVSAEFGRLQSLDN